jgi:catechol 2,3-dioxygenase-like lactoylglutathione lyase family enzyme
MITTILVASLLRVRKFFFLLKRHDRMTTMITALDHISLNVNDPTAAAAQTEKLLARKVENARAQLGNVALQLVTTSGNQGFRGLAFAVDNIDAAFKTAERRALNPQPQEQGKSVTLDVDATFGVPISLVERTSATSSPQLADSPVTGLDHIVVRTTHPNRAAALYGARLGLDLRLDRTEPKWGTRFMFFRCGDLIIEVVHNLNEPASDAPDQLWGLTWRVDDIAAAHARMSASGFGVSEMRTGRKPGTRVFTVRNNTLGVPTLILQPSDARHHAVERE